jgi:elongator complex protein 6
LTEFVNKGKLLYVEGLTTNHQIPGGTTDYENGLQGISGTISKLLASALPEGETILILDFPDIPLTMEPTSSDILLTHIAQWRQQAYATIVTLTIENLASASYEGHPHNAALGGASPVLLQQQQFVLSIAHHADMVFSTKLLDTGTAKDISGVVRITPRTGAMGDKELLYFVELGVGKGVEVWERGGLRG